jgi:hypothetical protein
VITVKYLSNNSGGSWWLKDEDWEALEAAGWRVKWQSEHATMPSAKRTGRWLGALATEAEVDVEHPEDAIRAFEKITGQVASDEGCNCCGAPHRFSWTVRGQYESVSGEDCLPLLFGDGPKSLREAYEAIKGIKP